MSCNTLATIVTKDSLNVRQYLMLKHLNLYLLEFMMMSFLSSKIMSQIYLSSYPELIMTLYIFEASFVKLVELLDEFAPAVNKFFGTVYLVFAITVSDRDTYLPFADADWEGKVWCFFENINFPVLMFLMVFMLIN